MAFVLILVAAFQAMSEVPSKVVDFYQVREPHRQIELAMIQKPQAMYLLAGGVLGEEVLINQCLSKLLQRLLETQYSKDAVLNPRLQLTDILDPGGHVKSYNQAVVKTRAVQFEVSSPTAAHGWMIADLYEVHYPRDQTAFRCELAMPHYLPSNKDFTFVMRDSQKHILLAIGQAPVK